jgi:nondiscriminating aspartyl-tRNA synthetase
MVHALRSLGGVSFIILRRFDGVAQCVLPDDIAAPREGDAIELTGDIKEEPRAPGGFEVIVSSIRTLSTPAEPMPVPIHKTYMNLAIDTDLSLRPITLRNLRKRAVMKLQEGLVRGFRDELTRRGFTEIHSPKIEAQSAEGGASVFKLPYFNQRACLAQSPQFYKQMMVGVFERVFEVGPVFRAEKHNTARHLNEYTSLDFEMGFIDSFEDIMAMETAVLQHMIELLRGEYAEQIGALGVSLPDVSSIPALRFDEAKRLAAETYDLKRCDPFDMSPEEEQAIGRYAKERLGSEFIFVTHYPSKKRPVYAMDDPDDPRYTLSFDLLFRGMEVTTGGQRIHEYEKQLEKIRSRGMDEAGFQCYLLIHKHGMPPHGGLGMGLERLLKQLIETPNIRNACLFPRDTNRLAP